MKISRYYTKSKTQPPVAFSRAFLKHPRRSAIMQRFDFDWERVHRLLPQICHYGRGVDPEEVLNAYNRVEEFIREMTHWRLEHATQPFLKPLAYAHFLAGVLAASWVKTADANKKMSCFPPNMRRLLGPMTQAALDHMIMAADLEPQINDFYRDTDRSHYGEAAITCALAEVTNLALHVKAYLPIGSEPFTRLNLAHMHREYRQAALMKTALMPVDGEDWLRVCAVGIVSLADPERRTNISLPKSADTFGLVAHDIKRQLLDDSELRLFYVWSRMHDAYREIEEFEYRKAAMTTPNMHYPEIMPLLPDCDLTTRAWVRQEQAALDAIRTPSFPHDTLRKVNFCPVWDRRLAVAMIFGAPKFAMISLFRRSLYHYQALNERNQAKYCQEACEAALAQLNQLTLPENDELWFRVNLTAILARALNTQNLEHEITKETARTVLDSIDVDALRALPLRDRWLYHDIAAEVIGGSHRGLATRGRNLAKTDRVPKSCDLISDARMLMALLARDFR